MSKLNSFDLVNKYITDQESLDTLRFITCGSVDDGKSTLIGRMLYESQMIFEDQLESIKNLSKKIGTQGNKIDFALLVDGLAAEQQQGITIDVAYRFFTTDNRKFIVADTPGHEQYTRNMVTGGSTADLAIILVDARKGILSQTYRHSIICSTLGIRKIVLAINKMDLVNYSLKIYDKIKTDFTNFAENLHFESIIAIPISAITGENIINRSKKISWYSGPTLISYLETVDITSSEKEKPFCLPVQWVNRPHLNFRGFSGTIESGCVKVGDEISILPSRETAKVNNILLYKDNLLIANARQAVTITLDREIDVSRGDIIVDKNSPCKIADQFSVKIVWMDQEPGYTGRSYLMKINHSVVNLQITNIKNAIKIDNLDQLSAKQINLNDICTVTIKTDKMIPYDTFMSSKGMGGFILIDKLTNRTIAAGMIQFALARANNIQKFKLDVDKNARRQLTGHTSKVLWFTGISGSGKSTIANALEIELHKRKILTYILDGDNIRHGLNRDLGFTDADRIENIRRISEIAKLMVDSGIFVLTAFISPFIAERNMARKLFGKEEFIEIFVNTPLDVAEGRDPKGLYRKAREGKIPNFTGIDSIYEKPENPEIVITTEKESVQINVKKILKKLNL